MLTPSQFGEYFRAIHGAEPFPWQQRLLENVVLTGQWPSTLSLPTGSGKTAILDISLFALACGTTIPRRTILVVDRRIVVDDAHRRALTIQAHLSDPQLKNPTLILVRDALLELGGRSAVEVALLRGGIYREDNWVRDPLQPTLVCSTVDQVGSRLLHQGYGVSPHSRSIHAGLLGNDTLIVLDEAHTSEPFRQTLDWIAKYRTVAEKPLDCPFAVVIMTATPRGIGDVFALDEADRCHPTLAKRLGARKILTLVQAAKPKDDGLVDELVKQVWEKVQTGGRTILVVVNRVKIARRVAQELERLRTVSKSTLEIDKPLLLTGRSRPLEREALLEANKLRLYSGRNRSDFAGSKTLVVVATQCVEVGADLDVDALVSEACPLDSFRQRLGRLDRLGEMGSSSAVLVAPREKADSKPDAAWEDLVYGEVPAKAWVWLKNAEESAAGELDVGVSGWDRILPPQVILRELETTALDAPVLFPAYCDLWVQTSPEPSVIPDPALFLHGPQHGEPEVQILWRADLDPAHPQVWAETVSACPPVVGETLRLPLFQARRWLEKGKDAAEGSDLEGERIPEEGFRRSEASQLLTPFLRWTGRETSQLGTSVREIRPGDTLVVPCEVGGCDEWGWIPESTELVQDLADQARWKAKRPPILRLHESCLATLPSVLAVLPRQQTDEGVDSIDSLVKSALQGLVALDGLADSTRAAVAALQQDCQVARHPSGTGWILSSRTRMTDELLDFTSEDDSSSKLARSITLTQHLADVKNVSRRFAEQLGLTAFLVEDLALAGWLHDLGKADPRFQTMLHGGNRILALQSDLLAKSPRAPASLAESARAREKSGYPEGGRHELLSVRLAESSPEIQLMAHDWELVLHLVGSHHGRCRPFAPLVEDTAPRQVEVVFEGCRLSASSDGIADGRGIAHLSSGVPERFWTLVRRYGWWGLSYLEACLRLADWRASELEAKGVQP